MVFCCRGLVDRNQRCTKPRILRVLLPHAGQPAPMIMVGLEGMSQKQRRAWQTKRSSEPRRWWVTIFRELTKHHWPRQLFLPRHLSPGARAKLVAHPLSYVWQTERMEREAVAPWLETYVQLVLPELVLHELPAAEHPAFVEELLKTFDLPLHANGVRGHLRQLWEGWRKGEVDRRLVRPRKKRARDAANAEGEEEWPDVGADALVVDRAGPVEDVTEEGQGPPIQLPRHRRRYRSASQSDELSLTKAAARLEFTK